MTQSLAQKGKLCRVGEGIHLPESGENYVISETEEEKGSGDEESERGGGSLDKEMEKGGKRKAKWEWKKRAGAGLPASKRQKLSQDQDEKMLKVLAAQDDKMGRFYQETLTSGIDKLVGAIASTNTAPTKLLSGEREVFEQRLAAQEASLVH